MKVVFMGTPVFSLGCLTALLKAGEDVRAVFTQPDKPKNRGNKLTVTPVKEYALQNGIAVYQPVSLRKGEDAARSLEILREIEPDCIVVVAYGQILPKEILELPKYGCVNVHASLLPMYRGAAPIQRCIENGETETGVTTMFMAEGLDTGDMLLSERVEITPEMTGSELHDILSEVGARLIVKTLDGLEHGTVKRIPQVGDTCYASMITKEELKIDFSKPAKRVYDLIRAMSDSPCAYTILDGKRLKVYRAAMSEVNSGAASGTIADEKRFAVTCGDGRCVELREICPEGGKRMALDAFLRGRKIEKGAFVG